LGNQSPRILYRDDFLLAVDKPSGMPVHRGWAADGPVLVDRVRELLKTRTVHPLHRLDRGSSGVMLFALSPQVAAIMQGGFGNGQVEKHYLALVRGLTPDAGVIDHPLRRREGGPRMDAQTRYRRLASAATRPRHVSWVEAIPRNGRLHQVRRHLKHINHPVIGDANYGKGPINREMASRYGLRRMALHAAGLRFVHPQTRESVEIRSPVPADLMEPLRRMGFDTTRPEV
jgi:tRNA pseudouridine65 synthase